MTREEHLDSCKICVNRKFTFEQGIICNLTGRIADFELECKNYKVDQVELKNHIPSAYQKYIDKHAQFDREFEPVGNEGLIKYNSIKDIPAKILVKDNVLYSGVAVLFMSFVLVGAITDFDKEFKGEETFGYLILTVFALWLLKIVYDTATGKYDFIILSNGIRGRKKILIEWRDIEFILLAAYPKRHFLVVGQKNGNSVSFDITGKNVSRKKISHICYLYHQHAKKITLTKDK